MPPRKKSGISKRKRSQDNEVQQIKIRLMEIAFKVDDHVYQNHPIPAKTAAMYIEEISILKQRSGEDVHTLQVAEKLKRVMTQIIAEETESAKTVISSSKAEPVKQCTDSQYCKKPTQNATEPNETVDLCYDDNEGTAVITKQISVSDQVMDVTGTIYGLSMDKSEINLRSQENITENYSQSILINLEHLNDGQRFDDCNIFWPNKVANDQHITQFNLISKSQIHQSKTVNLCDDDDNDAIEVIANKFSVTNQVVDAAGAINSLSMDESDIHQRSQNVTGSYSQITLTNVENMNDGQGFDDFNRAWQSNVAVNQLITPCDLISKSDIYPGASLKEVTNTTDSRKKVEVNTPAVPKKRSVSKKSCSECVLKTEKIKNTRKKRKATNVQTIKRRRSLNEVTDITKTYTPEKTAPMNIRAENNVAIANTLQISANTTHQAGKTSDNVVLHNPNHSKQNQTKANRTPLTEDLSWVEGIKFIREIHHEEYSPADGLAESFWNNCEFPPDWDEKQFSLP